MADTQGLDPKFAVEINQLVAASNGKIWINSGYRSPERQAQLYSAAVAKYGESEAGNWVAPPGRSNHNKGLAVDLGGDLNLARQLAPRFGLTFPMSWEPWHIEPVGIRSHTPNPQEGWTPPPEGGANGAVHSDGYNSIHNQIYIFQRLLEGADPQQVDQEITGQAAPLNQTGEPVHTGMSGETTPGGTPGQWNAVTWAHDFLTAGGFPTTEANMKVVQAWEQAEGGLANNNPLNTTQGGYAGETDINSVGVKKYATYDDSIRANLKALNNGRYGNIIQALQAGNDPMAVANAIEASPWGTGALVKKILGGV